MTDRTYSPHYLVIFIFSRRNPHCKQQTETKYSPNPGLLDKFDRSKGYLRI